jgi:Methyltransferase domain
MGNQWLHSAARTMLPLLPAELRRRLWIISQGGLWRWPPVGRVKAESLWRLRPISRMYGLDRGQPIDRYYIERFLTAHAQDIHGHVLEVADDLYTRRFGGSRVTRADVLHIEAGHPKVTVVADLTQGDNMPSNTYDCIVCTQTLPVIYQLPAAIQTLQRILKPGGVLLLTVPGISKISRYDMDRWGYYWGFTSLSVRKLLAEAFPAANLMVTASGNVLTATAFLHGLAAAELTGDELAYSDPDYEVNIAARAWKPLA